MTTLGETVEKRNERIAKLNALRHSLWRLARDCDKQIKEIEEEIAEIHQSVIDDLATARHTQGIAKLS